jgi:hypothetical protein
VLEDWRVRLILAELRKVILVASQFFEFLHSLGQKGDMPTPVCDVRFSPGSRHSAGSLTLLHITADYEMSVGAAVRANFAQFDDSHNDASRNVGCAICCGNFRGKESV